MTGLTFRNGANPRMRTIVVEDSPEMMKAVCEYLAARDVVEVVGTAANGLEALRQIEGLRPDLIITDLEMPEMGGLQFLLRLDKSRALRQVIVITVHDVQMVRDLCVESGVAGFVPKDRFFEEMPRELMAAYQRYVASRTAA